MTVGRAFPILISTLILSGCSDGRGRALKTIKRMNVEDLRNDVAKFYKNIFAEHRKTIYIVNEQLWPRSFVELHPERVTAYPDGFAFRLESKGDTESGLYIVPLGMDHEPTLTPWASFEKISDGIFWYSFNP